MQIAYLCVNTHMHGYFNFFKNMHNIFTAYFFHKNFYNSTLNLDCLDVGSYSNTLHIYVEWVECGCSKSLKNVFICCKTKISQIRHIFAFFTVQTIQCKIIF